MSASWPLRGVGSVHTKSMVNPLSDQRGQDRLGKHFNDTPQCLRQLHIPKIRHAAEGSWGKLRDHQAAEIPTKTASQKQQGVVFHCLCH